MSDQPGKRPKLLALNRETIRDLTETEVDNVLGGAPTTVLTVSGECPPTGGKYGGPTFETGAPTRRYVGETAVCGFQK